MDKIRQGDIDAAEEIKRFGADAYEPLAEEFVRGNTRAGQQVAQLALCGLRDRRVFLLFAKWLEDAPDEGTTSSMEVNCIAYLEKIMQTNTIAYAECRDWYRKNSGLMKWDDNKGRFVIHAVDQSGTTPESQRRQLK